MSDHRLANLDMIVSLCCPNEIGASERLTPFLDQFFQEMIQFKRSVAENSFVILIFHELVILSNIDF
jgi:hypothetical protein